MKLLKSLIFVVFALKAQNINSTEYEHNNESNKIAPQFNVVCLETLKELEDLASELLNTAATYCSNTISDDTRHSLNEYFSSMWAEYQAKIDTTYNSVHLFKNNKNENYMYDLDFTFDCSDQPNIQNLTTIQNIIYKKWPSTKVLWIDSFTQHLQSRINLGKQSIINQQLQIALDPNTPKVASAGVDNFETLLKQDMNNTLENLKGISSYYIQHEKKQIISLLEEQSELIKMRQSIDQLKSLTLSKDASIATLAAELLAPITNPWDKLKSE